MGIRSDLSTEELKKHAEILASIAVQDGITIKQIRGLYEKARNSDLADFEVFLKYQMGRTSEREGSSPIISKKFGDTILLFIQKYSKDNLITFIKYTAMLYDYTKNELSQQGRTNIYPSHSQSQSELQERTSISTSRLQDATKNISQDIEQKIVNVIKSKTINYGYEGISLETSNRGYKIVVRLSKFHDDPKVLSNRLENALLQENVIPGDNFIIWIQKTGGSRSYGF